MPETRGEWVLFLVGLGAIGALIAAIALHDTNSGSPSATTTTKAEQTAGTKGSVYATTSSTTTTTTTPSRVSLRLVARKDTWLSVERSGSVVYVGTLTAGKALRFTGTAFKVRFGAASNVAATLDGRPLTLPSGTYTVSITSAGLGARSAT